MNKFKFWLMRKRLKWLKKASLTPKGVCLRDYCQKIADGSWTEADQIQAYEDHIEELNKTVIEKNPLVGELMKPEAIRQINCRILADILGEMKAE